MQQETTMNLIQEELLKAGELAPVTPEQLKLDGFRMTSETEVPDEQFLFRFFGKPCFPRKELTTVTGPAKSGKTFFTSMIMACCVRQQVMVIDRVAEKPLTVMWYDTEQSLSTTKDILVGRIGRMVGGDTFPDEQFFVFNVRAATIQERREMLGVAIDTYRPDLVVLDGVSDLLSDINDGPQATELVETLMLLADSHECNITMLIHLNRTGEKSNLRGWLGSVLLQKSFEVFNCAQLSQHEMLTVEQSLSRKYRCLQTFYYEVDEDGLPHTAQKPDLQSRDGQGKFLAKAGEVQDTLNTEYIIRHPDNPDNPWEWDLRRLFADAMGSLPSMSADQLRQAVMKLSHIKQYQYYYKVFNEAEKRKVIMKVFDRYKRVVIVLSPQP